MTNSLILRGSRKERKSKNLKQRSGEWLIVCGGEKTEVNYIKSLINYVNRYNGNYKINYKIVGLSVDPKNMVLELNRKITQSIEAKLFYYSKIFVIFDKDDFCNNQIKQVISLCKNNDYIACLSNECFEVWIYLHFHALSINIPRKDLFFKLSNIFTSYGIGAYQKNDVNLFYKLNKYGNILKAYERAKKLDILKDSDDLLPQTTMYLLLDEIENHQRELELPSIYEIFRK